MTSSQHHNDVITVKNFEFPIKEERFRDVSEFKKRQISGTKLSITKPIFSAEIQCTNVTLARTL